MIKYIIIAIVGIIEAFGSTLNSKFRQRSNKIATAISSFIYALIWYYLIAMVIENIKNLWLVIDYGIFYSIGDVLALYFDTYLEKLSKIKGFRKRKKKTYHRKK